MSVKSVAAGTYNLYTFFLPALGEVENWRTKKEYLLAYWNELFTFTLYENGKEIFIKIDAPIANYTPMEPITLDNVIISSTAWCKQTTFVELDSAQLAKWNEILAKYFNSTEVMDSLYLAGSVNASTELAKAKKEFYAIYGDYPIYTTKKVYTIKQS